MFIDPSLSDDVLVSAAITHLLLKVLLAGWWWTEVERMGVWSKQEGSSVDKLGRRGWCAEISECLILSNFHNRKGTSVEELERRCG